MKPTLLMVFDHSLYPHTTRLPFSPSYLLEQALSEYFDVKDKGDPKDFDLVFNSLPILREDKGGESMFKKGKKTFFWSSNSLERDYAEYFDISDHVFYSVPSHKDKFPKGKSSLLLHGVDAENYHYIPSEFKYDIGFLGSEVEAYRINLLNRLQNEFKLLRGQALGLGVPSAVLLSQCKLVLSIDDYHERKAGIEYRLFSHGNVRPILMHFNPDLLHIGFPHIHYIHYDGENELIEIAKYYLNHMDEAEEIGANMQKKLKEHHTYKNRAKQIFEVFQSL